MYSKQYLLLAVLFAFVIYSATSDQKQRKGDSTSGSRRNTHSNDNDEEPDYSDDEGNDKYPNTPPFPYDRYATAYGQNVNYRPQSNWPAMPYPISYQDLRNGKYWARMIPDNEIVPIVPVNSPPNNPPAPVTPQCYSLIDSQYPVFSDVCGALPQARYALPNSFGHGDRWQLSHILTSLMSSLTDQSCIRSLRLLLCPMLFQPCRVRYELPLVLPCQAFCRAAKAQCASPALDVIPCEILPIASDLCPISQPFNPFVPSSTPAPPVQPQAPSSAPTARSYAPASSQQNSALASAQSSSGFQQKNPASTGNFNNRGSSGAANANSMNAGGPTRTLMQDFRQASQYVPPAYTQMKAQQPNVKA